MHKINHQIWAMERVLQLALIVSFLIAPLYFFSAPIGNPSSPAILDEGFFIPDTFWSNIQAGFTEDCLLQKRLKVSHNSQTSDIRKARMNGNAQIGQIAWSIRDRFNLEAVLGSGQLFWNWTQKGQMIRGETDTGFVWTGSAKLVIFEVKDTSFAATAQVGGWDGMEGHLRFDGKPAADKAKIQLRYWQAGAALTQKIGLFAPYLGCIVNQTQFKVSRLKSGSARLEPQILAGPFLGCTLSSGSRLLLNIEWRGWFEQGLAVSGQIRF